MPRRPFVLTAQQYSECWRERINKEQAALAEMVEQEQAKKAEREAAAAARTAAAEAAVAAANAQPDRATFRAGTVDRRAASSNRDVAHIAQLEAALQQERLKREELERAIQAAHTR